MIRCRKIHKANNKLKAMPAINQEDLGNQVTLNQ